MTWHPGSVEHYLDRWRIDAVERTLVTASSDLVFGARGEVPVVLKVPRVEEEARASAVLAWWAGEGAAPVLEHDEHAVLLLRATGGRDLAAWSRAGRDDEATAVLVTTALRLHRAEPGGAPPDGLVPLSRWFDALLVDDGTPPDAWRARATEIARRLLAATTAADEVVLHGDIHHGNVLDFGGGWAVIDPKGLRGHRAFDLANIFCNPGPGAEHLVDRRLALISEITGAERPLLAAWLVSWSALSVRWQERAGTRSWQGAAAQRVGERALATANLL